MSRQSESRRSEPPYALGEIFRMPLWLALLSAIGLVAALVGDGWLDALSWLLLAVPPGVAWRRWRRAVARVRAPAGA